MKRFRSWERQLNKHRVASVLIALLAVGIVLVIFGGYRFNWNWTGFNSPSKTLWDWLQLLSVLAVPIVVGFGAVWFTTRQGKVSDAENKDNQRETALQAYIDKMSELLLEKKLRGSAEEDEARKVAWVRTLTVLRRMDGERKGSVLRFLYASGLIDKNKQIISLSQADLSVASLSNANLKEADLREANLRGADLRGAYLYGADLFGADLRGADLSSIGIRLDIDGTAYTLHQGTVLTEANLKEADLRGTNLSGAFVKLEELYEAKLLKGATMPDGSIHP